MAQLINDLLTLSRAARGEIRRTTVDLGAPGWDQIYGWGRLDVGAVAEAAYLASVPEPAAWLLLVSAGIVVSLWKRRL